jgi:hypothetical protein
MLLLPNQSGINFPDKNSIQLKSGPFHQPESIWENCTEKNRTGRRVEVMDEIFFNTWSSD